MRREQFFPFLLRADQILRQNRVLRFRRFRFQQLVINPPHVAGVRLQRRFKFCPTT